jgi:mTERF domain-containing protein
VITDRKIYKEIFNVIDYKMILVKPLTRDLEELTRELAFDIQDYPEIDRGTIMQEARKLNNLLEFGQKQQGKDILVETLGYESNPLIKGSIPTISENILYLSDLGVTKMKQVVKRSPRVLSLDIEDTIQPKVNYLESIAVKSENMGIVITKFPQIFSYDTGTIQTKVNYLNSIGIKGENAGAVITRYPQILALDLKNNLKPTYEFLEENFNWDYTNVVSTPNVLGFSLEKRIKPRYEFLKSMGKEDEYSASTVLNPTDKDFCKNLGCSLKEYQTFKEEYLKS